MALTDAELVSAFRDGHQDAFAELYDRYADRIHTFAWARLREDAAAGDVLQDTFVAAAERIDQLRDPERFRAWLYAIARNRITDAARRRSRIVPSDELIDLPSEGDDPQREVEVGEVAALLWSAAASLQPRDQELLELHVRGGLEGAELAHAMEVAPDHVYVMVKRMKHRLEKAVGSLLVARGARNDCPELAAVLAGWDGRFSLQVRSRVTRHTEGCDQCSRARRLAIAWDSVGAALPMRPAPSTARTAIVAVVAGTASKGHPLVASSVRLLVGVVVVLGTVIAWPSVVGDGGDSQVAVRVAGVSATSTPPTQSAAVANDDGIAAQPASDSSTPGPGVVAVATDQLADSEATSDAEPRSAQPPSTAPPATTAPASSTTPPETTAPPRTTDPPVTTAPPVTSAPPETTTPTTSPPRGPVLAPLVEVLDLGADLDAGVVVVTNDGDQLLRVDATTTRGPFVVGAASISVPPGRSVDLVVRVKRGSTEGDLRAQLRLDTNAGEATVALRASVEVAPTISRVALIPDAGWSNYGENAVFPNDPVGVPGACLAREFGLPWRVRIQVVATDSSGVASATATYNAGGTAVALTQLADDPSVWTGVLGPWASSTNGLQRTDPIGVRVTDKRGNVATSSLSVTVMPCDPDGDGIPG